MSETRITRLQVSQAMRRLGVAASSQAHLDLNLIGNYIDQEPDDADAVWDEIDTRIVELSEQGNAYHYVCRHSATKLFGVEKVAGAYNANVISLDYTLPQLLDKLCEMVEPLVPTLEDFEAIVDSLTAGREVACSDAETMARFIAALREKEKEEKEKN